MTSEFPVHRIPPTTLLIASIQAAMDNGATAKTFRGDGNEKCVYRLLAGETVDPMFTTAVEMIRALEPQAQASLVGAIFPAVTVEVAAGKSLGRGAAAARDVMVDAVAAAARAAVELNTAAADNRFSPTEITENLESIERVITALRSVQAVIANTQPVRLAQ